MRVGGTVQNTLKGGGTEKRRGETKIIKSGKLSQRVGALKRGGGAGTPFWTMQSNHFTKQKCMDKGLPILSSLCILDLVNSE